VPIGSYAAVPALAQVLLQRRPHSVVDLGLGFGGLGVVVREWLDQGVRPWKTYLVGVEAWTDYRNPVWDLYDVIYSQTIEEFLARSMESFDCVLLGDVLEHFEKRAGRKLLSAIQPRVAPGGSLLVITPARFFPQEAVYGNERERHRSCWTAAELMELGFKVERAGKPGYYCGECWFAEWRK
jgi:SAM-dependent methyltransferase